MDCRQLNERSIKDSYPLLRIDICIDAIAEATWFFTFDLRSGYHQVQLDVENSDKTMFITGQGTSVQADAVWFVQRPGHILTINERGAHGVGPGGV